MEFRGIGVLVVSGGRAMGLLGVVWFIGVPVLILFCVSFVFGW